MKTNNPLKLTEFRNEMLKILTKKFDKHQDSWKYVDIEYLIIKLKEQLKRIYLDNNHNESNKKRLLHIANYCYLIYQKLTVDYQK